MGEVNLSNPYLQIENWDSQFLTSALTSLVMAGLALACYRTMSKSKANKLHRPFAPHFHTPSSVPLECRTWYEPNNYYTPEVVGCDAVQKSPEETQRITVNLEPKPPRSRHGKRSKKSKKKVGECPGEKGKKKISSITIQELINIIEKRTSKPVEDEYTRLRVGAYQKRAPPPTCWRGKGDEPYALASDELKAKQLRCTEEPEIRTKRHFKNLSSKKQAEQGIETVARTRPKRWALAEDPYQD